MNIEAQARELTIEIRGDYTSVMDIAKVTAFARSIAADAREAALREAAQAVGMLHRNIQHVTPSQTLARSGVISAAQAVILALLTTPIGDAKAGPAVALARLFKQLWEGNSYTFQIIREVGLSEITGASDNNPDGEDELTDLGRAALRLADPEA